MYYSYILKSLKDGKYYYGMTNNIEERLKFHNSGRVLSTKSRRPFIIHYRECYETRVEARTREAFYKSIAGYLWLKQEGII